jgi:hypothetical protein
MAFLGADWSYARPGGAACAAAGVKSVGRYLAPFGDGREIEKDEYDDLTAHGITVWFVREGAANSLLDGYALGVSHAQTAVANLARLGLKDQVVYAAADFDVQPSQYAACDDYMRGFASVIGLERTGIYAGMRYINHCRDTLAKWYWQAGATSWDHGETGMVHIQQTTQNPPLPGTDHNYIYTDAHGQVGSAVPVEEDEEDMSYSLVPSAQDGTVFLLSQVSGNRYGVSSMYHVSLLQRAKKNDVNDKMLPGELDIVHNYLQLVNPSVTIDQSAVSASITAALKDAKVSVDPATIETAVKAAQSDNRAALVKAINDDAAKRAAE